MTIRPHSNPSPYPEEGLSSLWSSLSDRRGNEGEVTALYIGIGVPQYLVRDIHRSGADSNDFKKRPYLLCSGYRLISSFASIHFCFNDLPPNTSCGQLISINQLSCALYTRGVPDLGQNATR